MSPSDDNDYLFELLTNDKMVGLIDAATVNTITQKHLFYFLARFDDDIHCIKLTNKGSKIGVQDYDSAAGNPRKLLFDVIQKFNTDEKKAVMEALNKLTFNNLSVNKVLGDVDLPRVLQADLNETNAKKRINLFPPKYITAANSAKRQAETALTKLKKADTAAAGAPGAPGADLVASLKIDVGKAAKTYDELATAAAAEAAAAAAAAEAAAPTGTTDAELREAVEYANTHKIKAKKIADEAKTLVASDDYVELIKAADAADEPEAALATAKKTKDPKKALEIAQAALGKAEAKYTIYEAIIDKSSPDALKAATDYKQDADSALKHALTTLDIFNSGKKFSMFPSSMQTDINDLIKKAKASVQKATDAVNKVLDALTDAAKTIIKVPEPAWSTNIINPLTIKDELTNLKKIYEDEKKNMSKGLDRKISNNGFLKTEHDGMPNPDDKFNDTEVYEISSLFSGKMQYTIPANTAETTLKRSEWREKRIANWRIIDNKLKYIYYSEPVLREINNQIENKKKVGTVSDAALEPFLSFSDKPKIQDLRDKYLNQINKVYRDDGAGYVNAASLTLYGGGKQYNKKTLKYKQLKKKQTHRNQMHRTQNHRKQNHRKQTHKK